MSVPKFLKQLWRQAPSKRDLLRSFVLDTKGGNRMVASPDGTSLSVRVSGDGTPVVLVHGTLDGMNAHSFVEPPLAHRYEVWAYDRRGRGGSTYGHAYSLRREVEDLQAIIEATGELPHVVGHSFGAVIALQARLSGVAMRSLTVYEPPVNGNEIHVDKINDIAGDLKEGRVDQAIATMARDIAGLSVDEVSNAMAIPPIRKRLRDGVKTAVRELQAIRSADWSALPVDDVPTLVVLGEPTQAAVYPTPTQAAALAVGAQIATIAGQGHVAQAVDPAAFTHIVRGFLDEH